MAFLRIGDSEKIDGVPDAGNTPVPEGDGKVA